MSTLLSIATGWTDTLTFTLKADGTAVDLTGLTPTIVLHDPSGALVQTTGTVTVLNQTTNTGQVTYDPVANDFSLAGKYAVRWKVVDGAGAVVYFPNGAADTVVVYQA